MKEQNKNNSIERQNPNTLTGCLGLLLIAACIVPMWFCDRGDAVADKIHILGQKIKSRFSQPTK